jgi:hypothetical protein
LGENKSRRESAVGTAGSLGKAAGKKAVVPSPSVEEMGKVGGTRRVFIKK